MTTEFAPIAVSDKDIFRIEVSLSSRKTSVIVAPTYARLFVLEERYVATNGVQDPTVPVVRQDEWKLVCTGIPCVSSERLSPSPLCPSTVKVVIAEAESGLAAWDSVVTSASEYRATQTNFHVFRGSQNGSLYGIQFLSDREAEQMFESLKKLLSAADQTQVTYHSEEDKSSSSSSAGKEKRRSYSISKHEISGPCNFIHLAGITTQRTESCEKELTGTIRRKSQRSMSMTNLTSGGGGEGVHPSEDDPSSSSSATKTLSLTKERGTPNMIKKLTMRRSSRKGKKTEHTASVYSEASSSTKSASSLPYSAGSSASFDYGTLGRSGLDLGQQQQQQHDIDVMFIKQKMAAEKSRKLLSDSTFIDLSTLSSTNSIPVATPSVSSMTSMSNGSEDHPTQTPAAGIPRTAVPVAPVQTLSFSTRVQQNRGLNPLPSKFTPMSASTISLNAGEGGGKPAKRRLDSNRSRVTNISESMGNLPTSSSSCDLDDEDFSPMVVGGVMVERYAQKGPETSVEVSTTAVPAPVMDPDEFCNEAARRGAQMPSGAYSYNRYVKTAAKRSGNSGTTATGSGSGVLRRPASSVNASPNIPRSVSVQPISSGSSFQQHHHHQPPTSSNNTSSKVHPVRPASTISAAQLMMGSSSTSSYSSATLPASYSSSTLPYKLYSDHAPRPPSSSGSSYSSPYSDSVDGQTLADTAQMVSHYTSRMSEALQLFDDLVLPNDPPSLSPPSSTAAPSSLKQQQFQQQLQQQQLQQQQQAGVVGHKQHAPLHVNHSALNSEV